MVNIVVHENKFGILDTPFTGTQHDVSLSEILSRKMNVPNVSSFGHQEENHSVGQGYHYSTVSIYIILRFDLYF